MTTNEILNLSDEELPRVAGEVLITKEASPGDFAHDVVYADSADYGSCRKCGMTILVGDCIFPDPIPLTPANAFKWRDWAVEKYGAVKLKQAILDVYIHAGGRLEGSFSYWLAVFAQPKHYIKAAMICKENDNE